MRKGEITVLAILLLSFSAGVYFYPQMPDVMASHWNAQGGGSSYMSKFWGVFLMPLLCAGLFVFFILIPRIDPLKGNIEKFRNYYDRFVVLIILFLFYVYLLAIFWNKGARFDMALVMVPALGALFYFCGVLIENSKRNWFIGIRTPWTLTGDAVWDRTNKLGGKLFRVAAVIAITVLLFPKHALLFVVVPVIFVAVFTFVYSYFEYQKA
ncbi:MAG: hypothetical protein MSIBF_02460 [Candidatus Altiarchaeales archaeon IMC4]|nr:MAG: hypothetical protein MSIBF_02460 [Candidatus Altiarchaeales archaeon IMC4]